MTLSGIDKMRKAELLELLEKKGIEPPRTVADMRYALKRAYDDADSSSDSETDCDSSSSSAKPPPAKKAKLAVPAPAAVPAAPGKLIDMSSGDATTPAGTGPRLILHSVAKGLTWSKRGAMGRITAAYGNEPRVQYDALQHTLSHGDVQFVDVKNGIEVASALCQTKPAQGTVPPFDHAAFKKALVTVAERARATGAAVHIATIDTRTPGYRFDVAHKDVEALLVSAGATVYVYRRPRAPPAHDGAAPPAAPPVPAPAPPAPVDVAPVAAPVQAPTPPPPQPVADAPLLVPPPSSNKELRRKYILQKISGKTYDDFPLEDAVPTLEKIDKDTEEFWDLEERFAAHLQGRNEDYVMKRIKKGKKPIRFILRGAERVVNEILECRFELKRLELIEKRGPKDIRERTSFHGTHPRNQNGILSTSLLRFKHKMNKCKKQVDDGYFGSNQKGVYVSRYADYTLKYANNIVALKPEDKVRTIVFRTLPGKSKHITELCGAIDPTEGYDSHSSPEFLEWYLFDEAQLCPEYVFEVLAEEDTRTKSDDM